jgi:6-pyruvoyltetrahydropterin/6-carboxytetrahydropterin synthase
MLAASGIAVDLRAVDEMARAAVADFDHAYLNELEPFRDHPPTTERIARVVAERVASTLADSSPDARVHSIEAWEMPGYRIVYHPE